VDSVAAGGAPGPFSLPLGSIWTGTTADEPGQAAPISGLSHVQLLVSDVAASAKWYSAVLGLAHFAADPSIGYVALKHRAAKMVIVLTRRSDGAAATDPPSAQIVDHLAFAVPDGDALASWAEHLRQVGIEHPGVVLENGNPSLQLRDPDGVAIELVAPR
jgi:glyoxylase I family protein